jgi:hypothetical protein
MIINTTNFSRRFDQIPEKKSWNNQVHDELLMHKIHVYPAKFPSFLISKALQYAKRKRIIVESVGDIFCGCGTTGLEARINQKEFWGCDINPVATLIAKVKRERYDLEKIEHYFHQVIDRYCCDIPAVPKQILANERIRYWFKTNQIKDLYRLINAIRKTVPPGKYQNFFLVGFSNILKRTSVWLIKSIKPQRDPNKIHHPVIENFILQYNMMYRAALEVQDDLVVTKKSTIVNKNFLKGRINRPFLDMLITSPPYVTSYEYADLHQLSTLWLDYATDYRTLRNGTIGSLLHQKIKKQEIDQLDEMALDIYTGLVKNGAKNPKSALKYFIDIKKTIERSYNIINPGGLAVFVIGNTTYKQVYVDNAKYLAKCMLKTGFENPEVFKRKISSKILTPYRDQVGRFSSNKKHRKVYNYEFVIIAKKPNVDN